MDLQLNSSEQQAVFRGSLVVNGATPAPIRMQAGMKALTLSSQIPREVNLFIYLVLYQTRKASRKGTGIKFYIKGPKYKNACSFLEFIKGCTTLPTEGIDLVIINIHRQCFL